MVSPDFPLVLHCQGKLNFESCSESSLVASWSLSISFFPALAMRCAVTCNFFLQCAALAMLVPFCASTAEITVLFPFPTLGGATHCALHLHGRTWAGAEDKLKEQRLS
jgi:hypothetical protein